MRTSSAGLRSPAATTGGQGERSPAVKASDRRWYAIDVILSPRGA
ncbi:hypothetical protein [Hamadaea sp.]|nr:hypothetical protein [Hamadaea sp.]